MMYSCFTRCQFLSIFLFKHSSFLYFQDICKKVRLEQVQNASLIPNPIKNQVFFTFVCKNVKYVFLFLTILGNKENVNEGNLLLLWTDLDFLASNTRYHNTFPLLKLARYKNTNSDLTVMCSLFYSLTFYRFFVNFTAYIYIIFELKKE